MKAEYSSSNKVGRRHLLVIFLYCDNEHEDISAGLHNIDTWWILILLLSSYRFF
jgi:hypothetical protein